VGGGFLDDLKPLNTRIYTHALNLVHRPATVYSLCATNTRYQPCWFVPKLIWQAVLGCVGTKLVERRRPRLRL
jgi:hypothetical protein